MIGALNDISIYHKVERTATELHAQRDEKKETKRKERPGGTKEKEVIERKEKESRQE